MLDSMQRTARLSAVQWQVSKEPKMAIAPQKVISSSAFFSRSGKVEDKANLDTDIASIAGTENKCTVYLIA